ncbi:hypothetical protein BKA70DRAFT_1405450 [Coprinopsis sp. MPI-PUGE-AT-0042]|nr:hypothetical protein BKA70DRAFT_1405450 [Coprinopsis sp. MPI-PUGE-AT-0042]
MLLVIDWSLQQHSYRSENKRTEKALRGLAPGKNRERAATGWFRFKIRDASWPMAVLILQCSLAGVAEPLFQPRRSFVPNADLDSNDPCRPLRRRMRKARETFTLASLLVPPSVQQIQAPCVVESQGILVSEKQSRFSARRFRRHVNIHHFIPILNPLNEKPFDSPHILRPL